MNFNTLEKQTLPELTELFNTAFAEYFVKFNLTPEILREKIYSEDISLKHSMACFDNGKPVGFMFHAIREIKGKKVAYNAGTGVIKKFRGQNATVNMYEKQIAVLKEIGVSEIELEVIQQNAAAIKSYEKAGFRIVANLECFKGEPVQNKADLTFDIREVEHLDWEEIAKFCDWHPSWQHATATIQKMEGSLIFGAFLNNKLVGFLIAQPQRARVLQFGVAHQYRRKGIGTALFRLFANSVNSEISVINIDDPTGSTQMFLENIGLKHYLNQYKMMMNI